MFLLLVVIFVPKVDTPGTFFRGFNCAFDAEREVTGPVLAPPKISSCLQNQNQIFWIRISVNLIRWCRASKNHLLFKGSCVQVSRFEVMQLEFQSLFLTLFKTVAKFFSGNLPYHIQLRIDLLLLHMIANSVHDKACCLHLSVAFCLPVDIEL